MPDIRCLAIYLPVVWLERAWRAGCLAGRGKRIDVVPRVGVYARSLSRRGLELTDLAWALGGRAGIGDVVARLSVDTVGRGGGTGHVVVRASGARGLARLPLLVNVVTRTCLDAIRLVARARVGVVSSQTTWSLSRGTVGVHVVSRGCRGARALARLICPRPKVAGSLVGIPVTRCEVSRIGIDTAGLPRQVLPGSR